EVEPRRVEALPGTPVRLVVTVRNESADPSAFRVRIVGVDTTWSGDARLTPVLAPDEATTVEVELRLPLGFPGGEHLFGVEAVTPRWRPSPPGPAPPPEGRHRPGPPPAAPGRSSPCATAPTSP